MSFPLLLLVRVFGLVRLGYPHSRRPVVRSIRIVVAIFSYDGGLYFGVTGDYDGAPDIDVLTAGIRSGMDDLLLLAAPRRGRARRRASPAPALAAPGAR